MKGIFTTKVVPEYDDLPERRYHFPSTYLKQVERCVGDWIVYYEPRRSTGNQPGGRQVYFATAMVNGIRPDPKMPGHYYADVQGYFEFPRPVPFREGQDYFESMLQREDGATNKGAFGRAVRGVPDEEFWAILQAGMSYGDFWCTGGIGIGWRILLVDHDQDHNQQKRIRHDQVYAFGG